MVLYFEYLVFHHFTYEGVIDLESIEDFAEKKRTRV